MLKLALAIFLSLCGVANAQLAGGLQFPGPGTAHSSGGGGGCAEATSFLARKSGTVNDAAYTTLICGLVTDGVWAKLDAIYIFASDTQANALLSLKSATYNVTLPFGVTFAASLGFSNGYLDFNFNPTTASSPLYTQNSAHLMVWSNTNAQLAAATIGSASTNNNTSMFIRYTDDNFYARVGDASARSGAAVTTSFGMFLGTRSGANAGEEYQNTTQVGTTTNGSQAPDNNNLIALGNLAGGADTTRQVAAASFGANLNSTDAGNLYSRLKAYMTTVGICNAIFTCP